MADPGRAPYTPEAMLAIEAQVVAAAEFARAAPGARLIAAVSASLEGQLLEDAFRYLAALGGYPLAVARVGSEEPRTPATPRAPSGLSPTVLVTGAAGQIGRRLLRLLQERGVACRALDLVPVVAGVPALACDLSAPAAVPLLKEFCRPVTHVVHLAGKISASKDLAESYRDQFRVSVRGTLRLLEALPRERLDHFSFASSMTVYGTPDALPVPETHAVRPSCVYALGKLAAERVLADFRARTGVPVAVLRCASVYGPGTPPERAIPRMIARALAGRAPEVHGDGSVARDYIYVDDLCAGVLAASLQRADGVYNLGTGVGTTSAQLADALARLTGCPPPVRVAYAQDAQALASMVYDVGKLRAELGFAPRTTLEEGLRRTIRAQQ